MALALFDLDNTLLNGDSDYAWGQFLCAEQHVDAEAYAQKNQEFLDDYNEGKLDIESFLNFSLQPLRDIPHDVLLALRETFLETIIEPMILPKGEALLEKHRKQGDTLMIITATNRFVTEKIATRLNVEHLIATEPEQIDGQYTGKVDGTPSFQEGKVTRLNEWLVDYPHDLSEAYFYSDSHNDLPLLSAVKHPFAVNPDDTLKNAAMEKSWPILSLR